MFSILNLTLSGLTLRGKDLCASLCPEDQQPDLFQTAPSKPRDWSMCTCGLSPSLRKLQAGIYLVPLYPHQEGNHVCPRRKQASDLQSNSTPYELRDPEKLFYWSKSSSFISKRGGNTLHKTVEQLKRKHYLKYLRRYQALVGSQEFLFLSLSCPFVHVPL